MHDQVMQDRVDFAEANYICTEWDDNTLEAKVVKVPIPASGAAPTTGVNLKALLEKRWGAVCEKKCVVYEEGLCVHTLCAMKKKRGLNWREHMKPWETITGARR